MWSSQGFLTIGTLGVALWASLLSCPTTAMGVAPSPAPRDVCVDDKVDKEKLGQLLLDQYGVRRTFENSLPPNPHPRFSAMPVWQRLLSEVEVCKDEPCSADFKKKYEKDILAAGAAQQHLLSLLRGDQAPTYTNSTGTMDPVAFLTGPEHQLVCRVAHPAEPSAKAEPKDLPSVLTRFRIRGSTDGLYFSRDMSQFKSTESAAVGFTDDDLKGKRTDKLSVVIAYPFGFSPFADATYELIPYVGTFRNVVDTRNKPASVSSETVNLGVVNALYAPVYLREKDFVLGNWFTARADYLFDLQNDSRLFSLNLTYMPIVNSVVNDYIRVDRNRDDFLSFQPIFDVRLNTGVYTDRGSEHPDSRRDFTRVGTRFGIAFSSDSASLPLDWVTTYAYFHGFSGPHREFGYLKSALTLSFGEKKYFGVTASYSDGRREDTAVREHLWSLSLTGRY